MPPRRQCVASEASAATIRAGAVAITQAPPLRPVRSAQWSTDRTVLVAV